MSNERGMITTFASGEDLVVEWKIENFFNLPETDNAFYFSPDISFGGERWWLVISPNGSSRKDSSGHVDLVLCKCRSDRSIKQSFSLSLKTAKGEKYNEQNFTKVFGRIYPENCHLLLRFTPRSELTMRRSKLLPEGVLTVVCTMKNSTSPGNASSLKWYWQFFKWNSKETTTVTKVALAGNAASAECCPARSESDPDPTRSDSESDPASAECCHCKGTFDAESLSSHRKKCTHRPIKCPDCFKVIGLQKWLDEHECQKMRPEEVVKEVSTAERNKADTLEVCLSVETKASGSNQSGADKTENIERDWMTDVRDFLIEGTGVDVTFELETPNGKVEFFAHQLILALRSPYFADEFYGKGKNNGHLRISLKGIDPKAFKEMLRYCYDNKPRLRTTEDACVLFKVASDFKMLNLQKLCRTFIRDAEIDP